MKHKTRRIVLVCVLVVVIVLGLVFRYVPMNILYPPESAFHLKLDSPLPSELKVGDQLTVSARLVNNAWMSYKIFSGEHVIEFYWTGPDGMSNMYTLLGVTSAMRAGIDQTDESTFDVSSAGDYTLIVTASFSIGDHDYKYQLDPVVFHVIE